MSRIAVLTPSIPERGALLAEAVASVAAQTRPPDVHLIHVDHERIGGAASLNRLLVGAVSASCDWIALLADDDLLLPRHLEVLEAAGAEADIVYPYCRVEGRPGFEPNSPFDPERLQRQNYIPGTVLMRTDLACELKGWRSNAPNGWEDWDAWKRALAAGARFVCVPEVTWVYRFHGSNDSWRAA